MTLLLALGNILFDFMVVWIILDWALSKILPVLLPSVDSYYELKMSYLHIKSDKFMSYSSIHSYRIVLFWRYLKRVLFSRDIMISNYTIKKVMVK